MAVKLLPVVDSLDDVHESLRDAYEPLEGGKFALTKEIEIETPDTIVNLKNAQTHEKSLTKAAKDALKALEEKYAGIDPEIARTAQQKVDALERDKTLTKGEVDKMRGEILADAQKKIDLSEARATKRDGQIKSVLKTNAAQAAITDNAGRLKALLPHVLQVLEPVEDEETGEWSVKVMEGGREKLNGKGQPMTPTEYVASLREVEDFKGLFDGKPISGAGARGSDVKVRNGQIQRTRTEAMNPATYREDAAAASKLGKSWGDYVQITGE